MTRLIKGMYGHEFGPTSDLFGLRCGQVRGGGNAKMTHNSGWYNKAGEKLGFGDLSVTDFQRISKELADGELFIILGESASFWNFVTQHGIIGSMCQTKPTVEAPGVEYTAKYAMYVIARNQLYCVSNEESKKETSWRRGLEFRVLSSSALKALMVAA